MTLFVGNSTVNTVINPSTANIGTMIATSISVGNTTENVVITSTGRLGINTNAPVAPLHINATFSYFTSNSSFGPQVINWSRTPDNTAGYYIFDKSRSAAGANVVVGDMLGTLLYRGYDTTNTVRNSAYVSATVSGVNSTAVDSSLTLASSGSTSSLIFVANTGEVARFVANGNFGIATTSPGSLLQLGSTTYTANSEIRLGAGNGTQNRIWGMRVQYGNTATADPNYGFVIRDVTGSNDRFFISYNTGNVGIGTTNPGSRLQVIGVANSINFEVKGLNTGLSWSEYTNNCYLWNANGAFYTGTSTAHPFYLSANNGAVIMIAANGNVGINTTAPTEKLLVAGNISATGNVSGTVATFTSAASQIYTGLANSLSGTINLPGSGGAIVMDDGGHKAITWNDAGGNFAIRAGNRYSANALNDVYVKGVSDANSGYVKILMNCDGIDGSISIGTGNIGTPGAAVSNIATNFFANNSYTALGVFGSGELLTIKNNNVGIGTTNPQGKLHVFPSWGGFSVNDTYTSSGFFGSIGLGFNVVKTAANTWIYYSDSANAGGALIDMSLGGDLRFYTRNGTGNTTNVTQTDTQMRAQERMCLSKDGYFGISTSSPITRLHVGAKVADDSTYTYDTNTLMVVHQTPTTSTVLNDPKTVLLLARQGTSGQAFGAAAALSLSRYENSGVNARTRLDFTLAHTNFLAVSPTTVMTMLSSGDVGIGTTAPAAILHVYKGINANNIASSGTTDASLISRIASAGVVGIDSGIVNSGNAWLAARNINDFSINYPLLLNPIIGTVGIGTQAPISSTGYGWLTINGATNGSATSWATGGTENFRIQINNGVSAVYLNTISNWPMLFQTNNTERMRINADGTVGINSAGSTNVQLALSGFFPSTSNASYGYFTNQTVPATSTTLAYGYTTSLGTTAASFTCSDLRHFAAFQGTFGAGSSVLNQYGFIAAGNLTGATNNYGFFSNIPGGTSRWNFYAAGSAANHMGNFMYMGLGVTTARNVGSIFSTGSAPQIYSEGFGASSLTPLVMVSNRNDNVGPFIVFGKSRGTAVGSSTVVQAGDQTGGILFSGADGTDLENATASIISYAEGTIGSNITPGRLSFSTTGAGNAQPTERMRIDSAGNILSTSGAIGYTTGAGGSVTQATNKTTAVTVNEPSGQITMNNAALAAGATAGFVFFNSFIGTTDIVVVAVSGGVADNINYNVWCSGNSNGSRAVYVRNISSGSLSDAIVLNFAVIKCATS